MCAFLLLQPKCVHCCLTERAAGSTLLHSLLRTALWLLLISPLALATGSVLAAQGISNAVERFLLRKSCTDSCLRRNLPSRLPANSTAMHTSCNAAAEVLRACPGAGLSHLLTWSTNSSCLKQNSYGLFWALCAYILPCSSAPLAALHPTPMLPGLAFACGAALPAAC